MLEAESMRRWFGDDRRCQWTRPVRYGTWTYVDRATNYPVAWLFGLLDGLHHAALLVGDIVHPVGLARGDQYVSAPRLDTPVNVVLLLDFEALGIVCWAAVTVPQAVLAVHLWVDLWEELADGRTAALANAKFPGPVHERPEHLSARGSATPSPPAAAAELVPELGVLAASRPREIALRKGVGRRGREKMSTREPRQVGDSVCAREQKRVGGYRASDLEGREWERVYYSI
jgi:hypothetical protein